MANLDSHLETLLSNLQSVRHLTTLELRLLQIQDEYQLLREFASVKENVNNSDMQDMIKHLRGQLYINKVPIPDSVSTDLQTVGFGADLLRKQLKEEIDILRNSKVVSDHLKSLTKLDVLITTDAIAAIAGELGILEVGKMVLMNEKSSENLVQAWLRIMAVLTSFKSIRDLDEDHAIRNYTISLFNNKDINPLEMTVWTVANFTEDPQDHVELGKKILGQLIPMLVNKSDIIIQHAMRAIVNLTTNVANRKVFEAWDGFDSISKFIYLPMEILQEQAIWIMANLASKETAGVFEKNPNIVRSIYDFAFSSTPAIRTVSLRFLGNFILTSSNSSIIIYKSFLEKLQSFILSEFGNSQLRYEYDIQDLCLLKEAIVCVVNLIFKDESMGDLISNKLLNYLINLLYSSNSLKQQVLWGMVYMSLNGKHLNRLNHAGILNRNLKLHLDSGDERLELPAAWIAVNFADHTEFQDKLRENEILISLVRLLFAKSHDVRLAAGKALSRLSTNSKNKVFILHAFGNLSKKYNLGDYYSNTANQIYNNNSTNNNNNTGTNSDNINCKIDLAKDDSSSNSNIENCVSHDVTASNNSA